ncbi:SCO0930 family lipoprotein [Streptomyces sp. TG1A-8]|uniref:SCO0930 family lipoprotein n=1 Tax=Streptomyces sp. TG1A-8 TaxID=3051385 RepID=UPI00265BE598|nr:SCO0930 family lipoprotein [Streptomyces sp. TG1A-8]MDO0924627.1 SCO0930 family lipoprotein [Streptomyces sp. TG1A-8]
MKTSWRAASLVAAAASVLALTTACGQDSATTPASAARNVGATAAAGDYGGSAIGAGSGYGADGGQSSAPPAPAGRLSVAPDPGLGKVLTDGSGLTLYRFDKDTARPPKSNCAGDCATTWPPVPADDATAGAGVDEALLGEVTRADGSKQLTVAGWPAYRYAKDAASGDVNGQGVGGTWFALAPTGKKAKRSDLPGLSVRKDPKLGDVVVDRNGMTVYRFMKDEAWPKSVSRCTGACLEKWPAVAPVAADDTEGVRKKGLMGFTRPDGVKQMTVNCWPVYTFSGDNAPGDTDGQGVGGTWYAVAPDGKPAGEPGN